VILDYQSGPSVITRVLTGVRGRQRSKSQRKRAYYQSREQSDL
jgi:hypothetical protein